MARSAAAVARYVAAAALVGAVAAPLRAQACDSVVSRTTLSAFAGQPIRSLRVETRAPDPFPGPAGAITRLHVRTREGTVRRQLLFAAGDTVDTLAVAESLRRLRQQRYLRDVQVTGQRCPAESGVDLTITTVDDWSTKPVMKMGSRGTSTFGLTERNVLGTGREASARVRARSGEIGVGVALRDPWLPGTQLSAMAGVDRFGDGAEAYLAVATRERSVLDRSAVRLEAVRSTHHAPDPTADDFRRTAASLLVMRREAVAGGGATSLVAGVEFERTSLDAGTKTPLVGPEVLERRYAGLAAGVLRRSVAYDTVTWLLPRGALVDVPRSAEADVLVGMGNDWATDQPAVHADLWAGTIWAPWSRALVSGDVWGAGYFTGGRWEDMSLRAAVALYAAAPRGTWTARAGVARLLRPDPDVRAMVLDDPIQRALPERARLAQTALSASVERAVHVRPLTRSWWLDVASFVAVTNRWDAARPNPEQVFAGIVGAGLRLAPSRAGRGAFRIDAGFPVAAAGGVERRPFFALSVSPSFGDLRRRDGRRGW